MYQITRKDTNFKVLQVDTHDPKDLHLYDPSTCSHAHTQTHIHKLSKKKRKSKHYRSGKNSSPKHAFTT